LRRCRDPEAAGVEPEYACGLIRDPRGWWLLQLRPRDKPLAPGQLTCFGGRCEPGESAESCLRRELSEELGWCPQRFAPAVDLREGPRFIARFFAAALDVPPARLRTELGYAAILAPSKALPGLPVSPWHRLVLAAALAGASTVELATPERSA
jgi:8-oxo-dGTP pyrophosphatase MutT (NUDIX family)